MKRLLCSLLSAAILLSLLSGALLAAQSVAYTDSVLMAVNTNTSTRLGRASFTAKSTESAIFHWDETDCIAEANLPELVPQGCGLQNQTSKKNAAYTIGTTRIFRSVDENGQATIQHQIRCLYVGDYCSVWGSDSDHSTIQLSTDNAKLIGQEFDNKFKAMTDCFGSYWYDADGDGKIAIVCYDIHKNFGGGAVSSYTGGYFWMVDLIDQNGYIRDINYGSSNYTNGMDCISVDTYPGMGASTPFSQVSNVYSTLFHEFQHMLNFSYRVEGGYHNYYKAMEPYLNEAFSMAAEHLVCGADRCSDRVTHFNDSARYGIGSSLTVWNGTLSNYTTSYLFGQYLRTRYETLYPGHGNTIYQTVLKRRNMSNQDDTLGLIADLLQTSKETLIQDFWQAVYQKADHGISAGNQVNLVPRGDATRCQIATILHRFGMEFSIV